MSYHISLNTWSRADLDMNTAAGKLARVFRMPAKRGEEILRQVSRGQRWQFENKIPNEQADLALAYLKGLGFDVDLEPAIPEAAAVSAPAREPVRVSADFGRKDKRKDRNKEKAGAEGPGEAPMAIPFGFRGEGGELCKVYVSTSLLTFLTLGIYQFWAKTKVRHYLWAQTRFAGDRFAYHGTGGELFKGFLKVFGIFLVFGFLAGILGGPGKKFIDLFPLIFLILLPALIVGAWRYRLSRTSWRNIRFSFRGTRKDAIVLYLVHGLITLLTLGLYWPYFKIKTEKFWRENSFFGDRQMEFDGEGKDIFTPFLLAAILFPFTLGINWIWFRTFLQRYFWSHTRVAGGTFRFTATGREAFNLILGNIVLLVFTLGIAYPWVVVRTHKFRADHLSLEGDIAFDRIVQEMQESGAFGEEALDVMDVPLDVG